MSDPRVEMDESRFPLVICRLRGQLTDDDFVRMFASYERVMSLGRPYILVTDLRLLTRAADASQRQKMAERAKELMKKYGDMRAGSVLIIQSAVIRGAITAFQWLSGKQRDEVLVGDMDEALVAADKFARESGLSIPPPAELSA